MRMELTVVIPVYNEENILKKIVEQIFHYLADSGAMTKILFVDDGSIDGSWAVIEALASYFPGRVLGLRLSRNFGKDAAILAGLEHTDSEFVITMDADGQHPPEYLSLFLKRQQSTGCNVVNGVKGSRAIDGRLKRFFAWSFNSLMGRIATFDFRNASDFKMLDRKAIDAVISCGDKNIFYRALVAWIGLEQETQTFDVDSGNRENSRWKFSALVRYAINAIVSFSNAPLYFILFLGLVAMIVCIGLSLILGIRFILDEIPSGYSTLVVLLLMNLGFSMMAIGGVGLYVKNSLDQSIGRPRYIVNQTSGEEKRP